VNKLLNDFIIDVIARRQLRKEKRAKKKEERIKLRAKRKQERIKLREKKKHERQQQKSKRIEAKQKQLNMVDELKEEQTKISESKDKPKLTKHNLTIDLKKLKNPGKVRDSVLMAERESIEKKMKKRSFKLPFKVKSQLKRLAKKNKIQVILMQRNKNFKPTIGELKYGMLVVDKENVVDCPLDCVGLWNGKTPTVILPDWDLRPISWSKLYKQTEEQKSWSDPQKIIIRRLEAKDFLATKALGGKSLIWIIIGAVVLGYLIFGGGGTP